MNITANTIDERKRANSLQGLHTATFRKTMLEQYGLDEDLIFHKERFQDEDGKWWDIFVVALEEEDFESYHRSKVLGPVYNDKGEFVGSEIMVRNYYFRKERTIIEKEPPKSRKRMTAEERLIKRAEYYLVNKEKIKERARAQYQKNKMNPEWMKKNRARAREHYREKNEVVAISEEVVRRNDIKRKFNEAALLSEEEQKREDRWARIAELDERMNNGEELTELEYLELEQLYKEDEDESGGN